MPQAETPLRTPLWTPGDARIRDHPLTRFAARARQEYGAPTDGYGVFHRWSVEHMDRFWDLLWDESGIVGEKGERVREGDAMPGARFFPDARLNFAENLLRGTGDGAAIIFRREDGTREEVSWDDLRARVATAQKAMRQKGLAVGDRVAAMLPNAPDAVILMLAATGLGAIWSSCSPDFGERGVVDRFGQIEPKLFFAADGYVYAGKRIDIAERLGAIAPQIGARTVIVPFLGDGRAAADTTGGELLPDFLNDHKELEPHFERLPFDHPVYILFSSGTTGVPKCIVHRAGGVLLQHVKEHALHCGVGAGDRVFYFTTLGWMMWNWVVSTLATGATLMLFDGSPFHPSWKVLFDFAEEEGVTFFGTSAKFIDALRNAGARPRESHDLGRIHTIASTGSPLAPQCFDYVYDAVHENAHLASVSGGTDLCACFVGAVPWQPVYRGEIQGPSLAMVTDVWDDEGRPVVGRKGELVCARPFPSMPLGFWNDESGERYREAYYSRFPDVDGGVWCHGDFAEWLQRADGSRGGMVIHGRSDATLNPGGVRIGTAEIYNVVERLDGIEEAICIGQTWQHDTRVVLFVRMAPGHELTDGKREEIRRAVRAGASPRHVPAVIAAVDDIPRTKSGKITELAVRDVVEGREVRNVEALANPEALTLFRDRAELAA